MKDKKKIEAAKKVIELMQAYIDGKDIEKFINGKYITITESDSIEFICIYNISRYRVKPKYRQCSNKDEFIQLLLKDTENLSLIHKTTRRVYYIHSIMSNGIKLINNGLFTAITYNELFKDYEFYNRANTAIGIENK